jgi:AraC family transcriptional regulator of adaptative response/methylated-DNA-[protein]-cysteine methyltransferase
MYEEYAIIEKALVLIENNFKEQPTLDELAIQLNMSPFHLQKTFKKWVGISPKRFLQFMTIGYAKKLLDESRSVLDATYESGLSSPGRIHDLFVTMEAVSPGEYKALGKGLKIYYGFHQSPFGKCGMAATARGLCFMGFYNHHSDKDFYNDMTSRFPQAEFEHDNSQTTPYFKKIFSEQDSTEKIKLFVKGTNFQIKVWEALLKIPEGLVCSYGDLARQIKQPKANQAVGNAVGANPISYLIPCHRVIRNMGVIGNYHWGSARKKAMLIWESEINL